jgi:hypothetical protein
MCKGSCAASHDISGALRVIVAGDVDIGAETQLVWVTPGFLRGSSCVRHTTCDSDRIGAHRKGDAFS